MNIMNIITIYDLYHRTVLLCPDDSNSTSLNFVLTEGEVSSTLPRTVTYTCLNATQVTHWNEEVQPNQELMQAWPNGHLSGQGPTDGISVGIKKISGNPPSLIGAEETDDETCWLVKDQGKMLEYWSLQCTEKQYTDCIYRFIHEKHLTWWNISWFLWKNSFRYKF